MGFAFFILEGIEAFKNSACHRELSECHDGEEKLLVCLKRPKQACMTRLRPSQRWEHHFTVFRGCVQCLCFQNANSLKELLFVSIKV